jgi:hypothetical protein
LFVWFEGALEGRVAGVEGGHRDFGDFVVVVANCQAEKVSFNKAVEMLP